VGDFLPMVFESKHIIIILFICGFGFFTLLKHQGKFLGFEYSSGKQSEVKRESLPNPESPSKVFGIGEAMNKGQPILIFRQTRKPGALAHTKRNFFFISKLMESYQPEVKVIELGMSVSYPNGDYFMTILDYLPADGYGVIKKEKDGFKIYTSTFGYSEFYDKIVIPAQKSIESVLGPAKFDINKLITSKSKYKGFIEAKRSGKNIILYSFADACNSLPISEQHKIEKTLNSRFSKQALIIKVDPNAYTDPANHLYAKCLNIISVYNGHTKEIYPAIYKNQNEMENVKKFLEM
jgi:hypothetical protein